MKLAMIVNMLMTTFGGLALFFPEVESRSGLRGGLFIVPFVSTAHGTPRRASAAIRGTPGRHPVGSVPGSGAVIFPPSASPGQALGEKIR